MAMPSGYSFRGKRYAALDDLVEAFLDAPETADTHLRRGYVDGWLADELRDFDSAASVAELALRRWIEPGALTLASAAVMAPRVPSRFGDVLLEEASLVRKAVGALSNDSDAAASRASLSKLHGALIEALPFLVTLSKADRAILSDWVDVSTRMSTAWVNPLVRRLRRYAEEPARASRTLEHFPFGVDDSVPEELIAYALLVAARHSMMDDVVTEVDDWFETGPFGHTGARDAFWSIDSDRLVVGAVGALCERMAAPKRAAFVHRERGRTIAASGALEELEAWLAIPMAGDLSDMWNLVECTRIALSQNDDENVGRRLFREVTRAPLSDRVLHPMLMRAVAQFGNLEQFERLVQLGHDSTVILNDELRPLHVAAARSRHPDLVRAMAAMAGTGLDAASSDGLTPLALAALENPNPLVAEALLDYGADVNTRVSQGRKRTWTLQGGRVVEVAGQSVLELARRFNPNPEVAACLIKRGATETRPQTSAARTAVSQHATRVGKRRAQDGDRDLWVGAAIGSTPLLVALFHPGWAMIGAAYIAFNATIRAHYYDPASALTKRTWNSMSVTSGIWILITLLWARARFGS